MNSEPRQLCLCHTGKIGHCVSLSSLPLPRQTLPIPARHSTAASARNPTVASACSSPLPSLLYVLPDGISAQHCFSRRVTLLIYTVRIRIMTSHSCRLPVFPFLNEHYTTYRTDL